VRGRPRASGPDGRPDPAPPVGYRSSVERFSARAMDALVWVVFVVLFVGAALVVKVAAALLVVLVVLALLLGLVLRVLRRGRAPRRPR
jgi:Flp pilus assembly protein TadB